MQGEFVSHLVFELVEIRKLRLLKAPPLEEVVCIAPHYANERDHGKYSMLEFNAWAARTGQIQPDGDVLELIAAHRQFALS